MSNPDETSDPARIVADEASGEQATYRIGVTEYPRIRYGDETRAGGGWHISSHTGQTHPCGDCAVPVGAYHMPGCDLEECPRCHGQSISCDCESETLPELQEAYERLQANNAARRVLDADSALLGTIAELHGRHGFIEDIEAHRYVERLLDLADKQAIDMVATIAILRIDNAALRDENERLRTANERMGYGETGWPKVFSMRAEIAALREIAQAVVARFNDNPHSDLVLIPLNTIAHARALLEQAKKEGEATT